MTHFWTGCDETWIHHFEPESKHQSMQWKHPESPVRKKFKTQLLAGKVMLTIFWSAHGPIFCDFLEEQRTINSLYYSDTIKNKVKPALKRKSGMTEKRRASSFRQGSTSYGTTDARNYWQSGLGAPTTSSLQPWSYPFGFLSVSVRWKKLYVASSSFNSNEEVKKKVQNWLGDQRKEFFVEGIRRLVRRLNKCIEIGRDYVEK